VEKQILCLIQVLCNIYKAQTLTTIWKKSFESLINNKVEKHKCLIHPLCNPIYKAQTLTTKKKKTLNAGVNLAITLVINTRKKKLWHIYKTPKKPEIFWQKHICQEIFWHMIFSLSKSYLDPTA
jgi:hypothetical protein